MSKRTCCQGCQPKCCSQNPRGGKRANSHCCLLIIHCDTCLPQIRMYTQIHKHYFFFKRRQRLSPNILPYVDPNYNIYITYNVCACVRTRACLCMCVETRTCGYSVTCRKGNRKGSIRYRTQDS